MLLAVAVCADVSGSASQTASGLADLDQLEAPVRRSLEQAQAEFERVRLQAKDTAELAAAHAQLAAWYHVHDQVNAAFAAYDAALALQPAQPTWLYQRALLAQGSGDLQRALQDFTQSLANDPDYAPGWVRRGDLQLARGELDAAEADYRQALALIDGLPSAQAGLGQIAMQRGRYADAVKWLESALQQQPQASRLRNALGLALRNLDQIERARQELQLRGDGPVQLDDPRFEAISQLSRTTVRQFEQAAALAREGRAGESLALLARIVEQSPNDPLYLRSYGQQLVESGALSDAVPILERAEKADPGAAVVPLLLAGIDEQQGRMDSAAMRYARALELEPEAEDIRASLARLQVKRGRLGEAAPLFQHLAQRSQDAERIYALYWWGVAAASQGACAEAQQGLAGAVEESGRRHGWAMLMLARVRATCPNQSKGELQEALDWLELLHRQNPGMETAETLAMLHAAMQRFDAALGLQAIAISDAERRGIALSGQSDLADNLARYQRKKPALRAFAPQSPLLSIDD